MSHHYVFLKVRNDVRNVLRQSKKTKNAYWNVRLCQFCKSSRNKLKFLYKLSTSNAQKVVNENHLSLGRCGLYFVKKCTLLAVLFFFYNSRTIIHALQYRTHSPLYNRRVFVWNETSLIVIFLGRRIGQHYTTIIRTGGEANCKDEQEKGIIKYSTWKQPSCKGWVTYCLASYSGCGSGDRCSSGRAGRSALLMSEQLADISSLLSRLCSNISGSSTLTTSSNNWQIHIYNVSTQSSYHSTC